MSIRNTTKNSFEVKRTSYYVFVKAILCFFWGILLAASFIKILILSYLTLAIFIGLSILIISRKDKHAITFIEIDKDGIWVENQLLTSWSNYIGSCIQHEYHGENNSETLAINVEYYKENESGYFLNQLYFAGTEDRTEYEVIDAIEFFYEKAKCNL